MKHIILMIFILFLLQNSLFAEVSVISPSTVYVDSDTKSFKDSGTINSIYYSSGTLSYLTEFSYSHTDIRYKYTTQNLVQDEIVFLYSRYFIDHLYKVGIHTNTTTDTNLQNGITLIGGYTKWHWFQKKKFNYGVNIYHSYYTNGTDLNENNSSVKITQLTFNLGYFTPFKLFSNFVSSKFHYEDAHTYNKNLFAFEMEDIIYYKSFSFEFKYFFGELQTAVLSNGMIVYNSKDIIKKRYGTTFSYSISSKININLSYNQTVIDEYQSINNITNSSILLNMSYKL